MSKPEQQTMRLWGPGVVKRPPPLILDLARSHRDVLRAELANDADLTTPRGDRIRSDIQAITQYFMELGVES